MHNGQKAESRKQKAGSRKQKKVINLNNNKYGND
jgi:hypothetical protein